MTRNRFKSVGVAFALVIASVVPVVVIPTAANAACPPQTFYTVTKLGRVYQTVGTTVGKYNSSKTSNSTISYSLTTTKTASTTLGIGAKMELGWAIAKVEVSVDVSVTATVSKGKTVTNSMVVAPLHYGRTVPKAEITTYWIRQQQINGACKTVTLYDYGTVDAITAWPFFAECQDTTNSCTPKP